MMRKIITFLSVLALLSLTFCYVAVDTDGDGVSDDLDNCLSVPNQLQEDADEDWVGDACDNCPEVYNTDQTDSDSNGTGDACEPECSSDAECGQCGVCGLDGTCAPATGNLCDDGNACTANDTCWDGECIGGSSPCDSYPCCNGDPFAVRQCTEVNGAPLCTCICM